MTLCLGLDCSTQSLKLVVLDLSSLRPLFAESVRFDDLPFGTVGGVHRRVDALDGAHTVTAPPSMWLAALDAGLLQLKKRGCPMDKIRAVSGSAQQHGSVFWRTGASRLLAKLRSPDAAAAERPLNEVLDANLCFSRLDSPVWMDNSTSMQCQEITAAMGGAQALANLTGSSAFERFTGAQIRRFNATQPDAYAQTERISLVSSFLASLFIGDYAPIDCADGSGMNLLDFRAHDWSDAALDATAPGLRARLGGVAAHPFGTVGLVSRYAQQRFGFGSQCLVNTFSGDNPCSCAGLPLHKGDIGISLGTSDTLFAVYDTPSPVADAGHVFCSATHPDTYMALLCFKNGSLVREDFRNRLCGGSWSQFSQMLQQTPPGNGGQVGFFFADPEILPRNAHGVARFDADDRAVEQFDAAADVRALVESQFLSMRLHASKLGISKAPLGRLLLTGGASTNAAIAQVAADVFGAPVVVAESADSAARGAAYLAALTYKRAFEGGFFPVAFETVIPALLTEPIARPNEVAHAAYTALLPRFEKLQSSVSVSP
jgi:xylulokinase